MPSSHHKYGNSNKGMESLPQHKDSQKRTKRERYSKIGDHSGGSSSAKDGVSKWGNKEWWLILTIPVFLETQYHEYEQNGLFMQIWVADKPLSKICSLMKENWYEHFDLIVITTSSLFILFKNDFVKEKKIQKGPFWCGDTFLGNFDWKFNTPLDVLKMSPRPICFSLSFLLYNSLILAP